jgi:hypothetical protein
MGRTGRRNKQPHRRAQEENRQLILVSQTGANEDEEKHWNRKTASTSN